MNFKAVSLASILGLLFTPAVAGSFECPKSVYVGFDRRLDVATVGRMPDGTLSRVVGFEVSDGKVFVALSHRLLTFDGVSVSSQAILARVRGLTVDAEDEVTVWTDRGPMWIDGNRAVPVNNQLSQNTEIHNSGHRAYLEVAEIDGGRRMTAVLDSGRRLRLTETDQPVHALSWNQEGLAVVLGEALVTWKEGSNRVRGLAHDRGLAGAISVTLIDENRAVAGTQSATYLLGAKGHAVVVGFPALVRWSHQLLFMLDMKTGVIWAASGIEQMGNRKEDRELARKLVRELPRSAPKNSPNLLEAVRLVGCETVEKWSR